jgi:hypothetical protein
MSTAGVQEVRACLAKWTANDWRHAFALAGGLEASIRRVCEVPDHSPLVNNAGALAMPVLKRLGQLDLPDLVEALAPLAQRLEERLSLIGGDPAAAVEVLRRQEDVGACLATLAGCRLGLLVEQPDRLPDDLATVVSFLEQQHPVVVGITRDLLADAEVGRAVRHAELRVVRAWNEWLAHGVALAGVAPDATLEELRAVLVERQRAASRDESAAALRELSGARLSEGAHAVLGAFLAEAGTGRPEDLEPARYEALLALHRLLSQPSWDVSDADAELVEECFGRKVARVAVAELAFGAQLRTTAESANA